ncbi:hyphal tip 1 [Moniliophthora roreri MCA 2997]|uniref:ditrans,polycis-polyprenyl diphosphate synthase [(2E,6E)-farnesyldiphosphate specific] n=1 Tax=Moniliophthora roreri (strain MCA 2997) TaxID=1381753 RepID=V2XYJ8_MONRO|nr:hyphal tip 1 [Moniliophthora roreri MCA 2997]
MAFLAFFFLLLLHALYSTINFARSFWRLFFKRRPSPLTARRRKSPKHLSILFVPDNEIDHRTTEQCLLESVENAIRWCQELEIDQLSIYDQEGIVGRNSRTIQEYYGAYQHSPEREVKTKLIDLVYPPTPPASEAGSRPLSPDVEIENQSAVVTFRIPQTRSQKSLLCSARGGPSNIKLTPLTLHILSADSSKRSISAIASSLAHQEYLRSKYTTVHKPFKLTVPELESAIEGSNGFSPPDFMIVHPLHPSRYNRAPLELHGFPPWQIRLTEIYHNRSRRYYRSRLMCFLPLHIKSSILASTLTELEFREALDHFAGVEMRFGK